MRVTVHNYEAFLLDWTEGNLSLEDGRELNAFFKLHPELDERELLTNELPVLEAVEVPEYDKVSLFKGVAPVGSWNTSNYEDGIIAEVEGELAESEKKELHNFLKQDASFQKELNLYKQVFLKPDLAIAANKEPLFKSAPIVSIKTIIVGFSVAASLALLLSIGFNFNERTEALYAQRTSVFELPLATDENVAFELITSGVEQLAFNQEKGNLHAITSDGYKLRNKEKVLSINPLKLDRMTAQIDDLTLASRTVKTDLKELKPLKEDKLLAANLIDRAKFFLFKKSSQGIEKVEKAITGTTKPILNEIDNAVAYEQTSGESRKTWRFALGPIEINRITYQ